MRDKPSSLEEAVKWASQQEGVEERYSLVGKQKLYVQMQKVWLKTVGETGVLSQQW